MCCCSALPVTPSQTPFKLKCKPYLSGIVALFILASHSSLELNLSCCRDLRRLRRGCCCFGTDFPPFPPFLSQSRKLLVYCHIHVSPWHDYVKRTIAPPPIPKKVLRRRPNLPREKSLWYNKNTPMKRDFFAVFRVRVWEEKNGKRHKDSFKTDSKKPSMKYRDNIFLFLPYTNSYQLTILVHSLT